MIVYRVSFRGKDGEHHGYEFFPNKQEARQAVRDRFPDYKNSVTGRFNVPTDKTGLISWLNIHASHNDNG